MFRRLVASNPLTALITMTPATGTKVEVVSERLGVTVVPLVWFALLDVVLVPMKTASAAVAPAAAATEDDVGDEHDAAAETAVISVPGVAPAVDAAAGVGGEPSTVALRAGSAASSTPTAPASAPKLTIDLIVRVLAVRVRLLLGTQGADERA